MKDKISVVMQASLLLMSLNALAANRLEGEWHTVGCRLLSNPDQACEIQRNSGIIFGPDSLLFVLEGAPAPGGRSENVRYVDVGRQTEIYVGNEKQGTHVFENPDRMYVDTPTQRFYLQRVSAGQSKPSRPASTSSVPYGIWQVSHCEYYKGGTLLPSQPCHLKAGMKVSILPNRFVLETEGRPPRISTDPVYKEFPRWVEVQNGGSTDRIYTDDKDFISVITKTSTPDIALKLYFTKIEAVAAPVPPEPSQPVNATSVPVAREGSDVSTQERTQMLKSMGLTMRGKKWLSECDRPVEPKLEMVDLNGDGQTEVFVMAGDSICYGMAGSKLVLFIKDQQGKWQSNLDFSAGGYALLKNRRGGFPDLSIDLPGCAPVWGWNGSRYELVKKCSQ